MINLWRSLTEEELAVYKRGRNAKSYTMAKNATMKDYRKATGFEALMGYLYLKGETETAGITGERRPGRHLGGGKERRGQSMRYEELTIEGRNAVLEAFRSGKTIDKLFVQDGCKDGPISSITREARKHDTLIKYVTKGTSGSAF